MRLYFQCSINARIFCSYYASLPGHFSISISVILYADYLTHTTKTAMTEIDAHLRTRLRVIIWKQWKVPKKRQWGLQKLGISKDEARRTAYWGDRYQLVALKSCLSRAVSKEVLARAGLVCCLDYYNERHALKLC